MVAVVRVQPALDRPRGGLERRPADGLFERLEIRLVGPARRYERLDFRGDFGRERFCKAPFFTASAGCSPAPA